MKIPVYQQQVGISSVNLATPKLSAPPQEAFGIQTAQAGVEVGKQAANIGKVLSEHLIERQVEEDQKSVLRQETAFRQEMQDLLFNDEMDKDNRPKGILSRRLQHAQGSSQEFDKAYLEIKTKYLNNVVSDNQKADLAKMLDGHYTSTRDNVIRHETAQGQEDYKNTLESNIKQMTMDASLLTDPNAIKSQIEIAQIKQTDGFERLGYDQATIDLQNKVISTSMVKVAVHNIIESDYKKAQAILDANKDLINPEAITEIQQTIDGKAFDDKRVMVWNQLSGKEFQLADGNPNYAKMDSTIAKLADPTTGKPYTTAEQEKLSTYVKIKASEARTAKKQVDDARDFQFMNEASRAFKGRIPISEAYKIAQSFGAVNGPNDVRLKEKFIDDIYFKNVKTNPVEYINLYEKIKVGATNEDEINQKFADGKIDSSDFQSLRKQFTDFREKGENKELNLMDDNIENLLKSKIDDPEERARAKYVINAQAIGKTAVEKWKFANDTMKEVVTEPRWYWFDKKDKAYNVVNEQMNADASIMATMRETPSDPGNLIIQALEKRNLKPNLSDIKYLMTLYPDGKIPGDAKINGRTSLGK